MMYPRVQPLSPTLPQEVNPLTLTLTQTLTPTLTLTLTVLLTPAALMMRAPSQPHSLGPSLAPRTGQLH